MKPLWEDIFRREDESEAVLELLRKMPMFQGLTEAELKTMERLCHVRTYTPDEAVFYEGEPGIGMYVIADGGVRILIESEDVVSEVATLTKGECFGEIALLDECPRTATAITTLDGARLLGIFRPDLIDIINRAPATGSKVLMNISRIMGKRLIRTAGQISEVLEQIDKLKAQEAGKG